MKIAARINSNRQYSEDAWEAIVHIKEVSETTTIGELIEWQKRLFPRNNVSGIYGGWWIRELLFHKP